MKEYTRKCFIKDNNGNPVEKRLQYHEVESSDITMIYNLYDKWKDLRNGLKSMGRRSVNFPEGISEVAVAFVKGYKFLKQKSISDKGHAISTSFDCFDDLSGDKIQIKACSVADDLTSFGPKSIFDKLLFADFSIGNKQFVLYDIPVVLVASARVNANQTVQSQSKQQRRPRLSLREIVKANNIQGQTYTICFNSII